LPHFYSLPELLNQGLWGNLSAPGDAPEGQFDDLGVEVEQVGEVLQDIGGQIPVFLLLFPLIVILSLLSRKKRTRLLSSFSRTTALLDLVGLEAGSFRVICLSYGLRAWGS